MFDGLTDVLITAIPAAFPDGSFMLRRAPVRWHLWTSASMANGLGLSVGKLELEDSSQAVRLYSGLSCQSFRPATAGEWVWRRWRE